MTRKEKIFQTALSLLSETGFHATTTSRIASRAGVSEGLIFRHFQSKEGLLFEILRVIEHRFKQFNDHILKLEDPQSVIKNTAAFPFQIPASEYPVRRLRLKLKWEVDYDDSKLYHPLEEKLEWAFSELGAPTPRLEAQWLLIQVRAIEAELVNDSLDSADKMRNFLIKKYTFL